MDRLASAGGRSGKLPSAGRREGEAPQARGHALGPKIAKRTLQVALGLILTGGLMAASLAADPEAGRAVAADRNRGDCTICHALPLPQRRFHGTVGPSLFGVGSRRSARELRAIVTDSRLLNPASVMPAYGLSERVRSLRRRELPAQAGRPILTEAEIDDLVAWLMTLKTPEGGGDAE